MTDNLVERLRRDLASGLSASIGDTQDAADRIEELQKQLAASDEEIRALRDEIENLEYEMCEMENRS